MSRIRVLIIAALATLAVAAPTAAKTLPRLYGSVSGFTLVLKDASGKPVKTLRAGRYVFTIRDRSTKCNFHLVGPGVNNKTSVPKEENASWLVGMGKDTYRFFCDTRRSSAQTFRVS